MRKVLDWLWRVGLAICITAVFFAEIYLLIRKILN